MELAAAVLCLRREDADLGHQIVVDLALDRERRFDIDLAGVRPQIVEFGLRDEALRGLGLGQRHPNRAPEPPARLLGEERTKLRATVSPRERRGVGAIIHGLANGLRPAGSLRLVTVEEANEGGRRNAARSELRAFGLRQKQQPL